MRLFLRVFGGNFKGWYYFGYPDGLHLMIKKGQERQTKIDFEKYVKCQLTANSIFARAGKIHKFK